MNKVLIFVIALLLILQSCKQQENKNATKQDETEKISVNLDDYSSLLDLYPKVHIKSCIPLETNEKIIIGKVKKVVVSDDLQNS